MSFLTLIIPWVLVSVVVTPVIGAVIARGLHAGDEFGRPVNSNESPASGEEELAGLRFGYEDAVEVLERTY